MSKQEILDKLEEIGISHLTIKDLFGRGVSKRSLKEIFENITKKNKSKEFTYSDKDLNEDWLKRTFYFASVAHILLLIHSPRLYIFRNAPINACLEDSLDDLKIQVDSAVDGFDSDLYFGKILEAEHLNLIKKFTEEDIENNNITAKDAKEVFESHQLLLSNQLIRGVHNVVPYFKNLRIDRPLIYKKLNEAQEILKDNWSENLEYIDNKSAKEEFLNNVAEERETFYLDITEWD